MITYEAKFSAGNLDFERLQPDLLLPGRGTRGAVALPLGRVGGQRPPGQTLHAVGSRRVASRPAAPSPDADGHDEDEDDCGGERERETKLGMNVKRKRRENGNKNDMARMTCGDEGEREL